MDRTSNGVSRRKLPPKPKFVQLPMSVVEDPKISDRERTVLMAVLSFAWEVKGKRNPCEAGLRQIAHRAGDKGIRQTREILRLLEANGLISSEFREGQPTRYRVDPGRFPLGGRRISAGEGRRISPAEVEEEQVEKGTKAPPPQAAPGEPNSKPVGWRRNSRVWGTNPRAVDEREHDAYVKECQKASVKMHAEIHAEIAAFCAAHPEIPERDAYSTLAGVLYRRKMKVLKAQGLFRDD